MGSVALTKAEFLRRFHERFDDPANEAIREHVLRAAEVAWEGYSEYRKSPRTRAAGKGFEDPTFPLPVEWLETRRRIRAAARRWKDRRSPSRVLLVNGSPRSDQSCPGEMSKSYRLVTTAARVIRAHRRFEVDVLDLSRLTSEYGRTILPCKACVSTAMPLCNWPCSCYPNHAMGQVNDWMNELYPRWVAAHGVMIVTPVNWYQAPSVLKLMIDRLVCADGGNPDPTSTGGKDPERAKALELRGWHYPKHLAGRAFAVVVHGDAAGAESLRRNLCDWLADLELVPAGGSAQLERYVGYFEPYATSHDALDRDRDFLEEVRNAARSLVEMVRLLRTGEYHAPDADVVQPRVK
jgi:multimeric flavodoxin WrbA